LYWNKIQNITGQRKPHETQAPNAKYLPRYMYGRHSSIYTSNAPWCLKHNYWQFRPDRPIESGGSGKAAAGAAGGVAGGLSPSYSATGDELLRCRRHAVWTRRHGRLAHGNVLFKLLPATSTFEIIIRHIF